MIKYITYLPSLIISIILGFIIYKKKSNNPINVLFSLLVFSLSLWIATLLIADTTKNIDIATFFGKLTIIGPIFIVYLLLIFTNYFPYLTRKYTKKDFIILAIPVFIFIILTPTRLNIKETIIHDWGAETIPGVMYYFFIAYFLIYVGLSLKNLLIKFRNSSGIFREQIKYLFWGISISAFLSIITNAILPLFGIINFSVYAPLFMLIFIGVTSYSIIKHRLMDIRFVLRKSFIYVGLALFIFSAYYFVLWFDNFFFKSPFALGSYLSALIIVPLFLLSFNYLSKFLKRFANKYFFSGLYDYQEVLEKFGKNISKTINLDEVVKVVIKTIQNAMRLDNLAVAIANRNSQKPFSLYKILGFDKNKLEEVCAYQHFCRYLEETKKPVVIGEILSRSKQKENQELLAQAQVLKKMGVSIVLPFVVKDQINGLFILGHKISKDAYTKEDIELLSTLSNQAAVALENARLYQQVQDFTTNLFSRINLN
ncbi:MAG: histidine kinase N-terminal 7TM domain-containing protein [Patescibacteria group bacterium]|nr:histidine kinase N-terminal 7TM domain-containing protein [Patescibacteria group bacterium]